MTNAKRSQIHASTSVKPKKHEQDQEPMIKESTPGSSVPNIVANDMHESKKVVSSPLKKKKVGESPTTLRPFSATQQVGIYYQKTSIGNVAIVMAMKTESSARDFAYIVPISWMVKDDRSVLKSFGKNVIDFIPARMSESENKPFTFKNRSGMTEYYAYVAVLHWDEEIEDEDIILAENCKQIAKEWTNLAKPINNKFRYPIHFVFKGERKSNLGEQLSYHLMDNDCLRIMKHVFADIDTKEDLLKNEQRDAILAAVFGSSEKGMNVVKNISEEEYNFMESD